MSIIPTPTKPPIPPPYKMPPLKKAGNSLKKGAILFASAIGGVALITIGSLPSLFMTLIGHGIRKVTGKDIRLLTGAFGATLNTGVGMLFTARKAGSAALRILFPPETNVFLKEAKNLKKADALGKSIYELCCKIAKSPQVSQLDKISEACQKALVKKGKTYEKQLVEQIKEGLKSSFMEMDANQQQIVANLLRDILPAGPGIQIKQFMGAITTLQKLDELSKAQQPDVMEVCRLFAKQAVGGEEMFRDIGSTQIAHFQHLFQQMKISAEPFIASLQGGNFALMSRNHKEQLLYTYKMLLPPSVQQALRAQVERFKYPTSLELNEKKDANEASSRTKPTDL